MVVNRPLSSRWTRTEANTKFPNTLNRLLKSILGLIDETHCDDRQVKFILTEGGLNQFLGGTEFAKTIPSVLKLFVRVNINIKVVL